MNLKFKAGVALGVSTLLSMPSAMAGPLEDRIQQMEAELQSLKAMIQQQQRRSATKIEAIENKVAETKSGKSNVKLSNGTTLTYGGFIKVNAMLDDYQDGTPPTARIASNILVPSLIPVGGDNSAGADLHTDVLTSRIYFKTETETDAGSLKSYVELDLLSGGGDERISNSTNPRVRHAFLDWGYSNDASLLVGQTWSTFFNPGALPESVEFIGPTSGTIFNRQAQVRWTKKLGNGSSFMLAAENPSTSLADAGSGIANSNFDDNSIPDIVARYNGKSGDHSWSFAAIGREIGLDNGVVNESDFGLGVNLTGKVVLSNGDDFKYSIASGNLGRYIGLNAFRDGGIDGAGNLDLTTVTGGYVAYRHHWNSKLRSTIQYAMSTASLADGLSAMNTEKIENFNVNLMYSPTPKLTFGGELIAASRELENGVSGDLTRVQLTAKYGF
jgi:hypothetical protein